jgi:[ribosomal protein S18]-alanine N-acetyltransferase
MTGIRRGGPADFPEIAAIQAASPESSQWSVAGYDLWVAHHEGKLVGFLAARSVGAGERELLNLAVAPEARRRGVASALVREFRREAGMIFLEVRESNQAARKLYKSLGFEEISARPGYYEFPNETAIVMKFHSC